jgi:uncharacterized protein (DUF58 family)
MPAWDEAAIAGAVRRLRLAADPRRRRMGEGARLGAGAGASLEFHDHRAYAPGDDLRHLDWSAYARSGQLVIRRHRKEVSPRIEILLDASNSMAVDPAKMALATTLAALCATLATRDGGRPRLWSLTDSAQALGSDWRGGLRRLACAGAAGPACPAVPALGAGAERILISDGLCPEGPAAIVRRLGAEAGSLCLIQVLTRRELAPDALGAVRLVDVEGGEADLIADDRAVAAYRERLARLQAGWGAALSGRGAGLCTLAVEDGFEVAVRRLVRHGILLAAGGQLA